MKSGLFLLLCTYPLLISGSLLIPILPYSLKKCSDIEFSPDQCEYVSTCHGLSSFFLRFYYCSPLWKPVCLIILCSALLYLFSAVSVVAADFFCPNLQTISSRLQLSESMAGVTVLGFGNGSSDLFSTFTAMNSGSGSLALGELIGAAFFIVAIVSGTMGIITPFQSQKITFTRDASFLTGAIMIMTWIVYHQRLCWYHGVMLILYYLTYVITVVVGAYRFQGASTLNEPKSVQIEHEELITESSALLSPAGRKPLRLDIPVQGFHCQEHLGHIIRPVSPNSSQLSRRSSLHTDSYFPRTTSTNGSISSRNYRHVMSPRIGMRSSVITAIDFGQQVSILRRSSSIHLMHPDSRYSPHIRKRHSQTSLPHRTSMDLLLPVPFTCKTASPEAIPDYFDRPIPEIRLVPSLHERLPLTISWNEFTSVLFPTLHDWSMKTRFAQINAVLAIPLVLVFTLTLPVAEVETVEDIEVPGVPAITPGTKSYLTVPNSPGSFVHEEPSGWCRWLVITQAICACTFVSSVFWVSDLLPVYGILGGLASGICLSLFIRKHTKTNDEPTWYWTLSIAGFIIALVWIFLLVNTMVGLLQALGTIFSISEAILGLTIFAVGNSLGDLIANTAIAKMGFPTMAISACYAGPLLNIVLGVGTSASYQTWLTGVPYELEIAPTIIVSCFGLITVLLSTLIVVNLNGYHINKKLGWWMITVYCICTAINMILEFDLLF